jgi:hypothetical protein
MRISIFSLFIVSLAFVIEAIPAHASPTATSCQQQAARAVARKFREYFQPPAGQERRIIELVDCQELVSRLGKPYNKCEVSASNGMGAGDITFEVILSGDCKTSYAAYITGME